MKSEGLTMHSNKAPKKAAEAPSAPSRPFPALRNTIARLALAVLIAVHASRCSVNPATGKSQLALMSEEQEIQTGRQADQGIAAELGLYPDEGLQRYIHQVGSSVAAKSERPNLPWQFRVVDDPVVNAFALPGGFIYVTRGILAYFGSEAELVGVLGHEIGHVTARHSVEQMSQAQLASVGLGVAMIASETVRQFGGLAQAGMGLLFLKFGRDDERQADELGLRYLVRSSYDPNEMPKTFRTLDRVSAAAGGGRVPAWLSTHPAPEDRYQGLSQQVAALPPESRKGEVRRDAYLSRLGGLTFGPNPREGIFKDNVFYHPGLAFKIAFPPGWKMVNEKQAAGAVSPEEDAVVIVTMAEGKSPEEAAQAFFAKNRGVERGNPISPNFYPFRTASSQDASGQPVQQLEGVVGFVERGGAILQLRGMALAERWSGYQAAVRQSLGSFEKLTDPRYLNVQPKKVEIVRVPSAMSFEQFVSRYPSTVDAQSVAILNSVQTTDSLEAGRLMKRVVGGEMP
jgi:predicted Zn-dependent protease